jgi:4-amino-4-deoxy-L-arabinose transferase-like glycosyltransferase
MFMKLSANAAVILLLILAIAAALRFWGLERRGLYFPDETRYYRYARDGCAVLAKEGLIPAIVFAGNTFTAKPGHTLLGMLWMSVFGIMPVSALSMNAVFGILSVLLLWMIGKMFYSNSAGLIAAAVLSVSAASIYYSRSFMCHIDQGFFVTLVFLLYGLSISLRRPSFALRVAAGLFLGFAFTIHSTTAVFFILYAVYEICLVFLDRVRRLRRKVFDFALFFASASAAPLMFFISNVKYANHLLWLINEAGNVVAQRAAAPVPFILSRALPVYEGTAFSVLALVASMYLLYRFVKQRRPPDLFLLFYSAGIFLYWEFFSSHEKFLRQVLPSIPFFCLAIGVVISEIRTRGNTARRFIGAIITAIIILNSAHAALRVLADAKSRYPELERFLLERRDDRFIVTPSEYLATTADILMPGLDRKIKWLSEPSEIKRAIENNNCDLVLVAPSDWLNKPQFRFKTKPLFLVKEPQSGYFPEFYEGICFGNRPEFLKYKNQALANSVAVYSAMEIKMELR